MAKYVLTDCKIYVDDYNISGDSNSGTLELTTPALDASTFSSVTARTKIPGLSEMKASIGVLYDATTAYIPDDEIDTWKENFLDTTDDLLRDVERNHFPMRTTWCNRWGPCRFKNVCIYHQKDELGREKFLEANYNVKPMEEEEEDENRKVGV